MKGYQSGFICLHRKMTEWGWYRDLDTKAVFLHLLLTANWEEREWMGVKIPAGSLVTSTQHLAEDLSTSRQRVRTALDHLKSTNDITTKSTNKFTVVTIVNWEKYQGLCFKPTSETTSELTNEQPTTNQQLTTNEQSKQLNNIGVTFKKPTPEQVEAYSLEKGHRIDGERFCDFYQSKGWMVGKDHMKDWQACVRTWINKEQKDKPKSIYEVLP